VLADQAVQALLLKLVHGFHGLQQFGHIAGLLSSAHKGLDVFGEAGAAVAAAGPDELEANARVGANANAHAFGQVGELVHERDLGGQHGVGEPAGGR
jgi:hypothetical protein